MVDYLYEVASRLVAFDTVSAKSDRDAMEYIAGELAPRGFKTALQPVELLGVAQANLVAWVGPPRADGLMISGHVDTVPFDGQPGWDQARAKRRAGGMGGGGELLLQALAIRRQAARALRRAPGLRDPREISQRNRRLREAGSIGPLDQSRYFQLGRAGAGRPEACYVRMG